MTYTTGINIYDTVVLQSNSGTCKVYHWYMYIIVCLTQILRDLLLCLCQFTGSKSTGSDAMSDPCTSTTYYCTTVHLNRPFHSTSLAVCVTTSLCFVTMMSPLWRFWVHFFPCRDKHLVQQRPTLTKTSQDER